MKYRYNDINAAGWLLSEDEDKDDTLVDAEDLEDEEETSEEGITDRLDAIEDKLDTLVDREADEDDDTVYDIDLANPVCPHCGARLRVIDDTQEAEDIDDGIIDGEFDSEETDDEQPEDFETSGEPVVAGDEEEEENLEAGDDDDYVNFDDILAGIEEDEDEEKK